MALAGGGPGTGHPAPEASRVAHRCASSSPPQQWVDGPLSSVARPRSRISRTDLPWSLRPSSGLAVGVLVHAGRFLGQRLLPEVEGGSEAWGSSLQLLLDVTVLAAVAIAGLPLQRTVWHRAGRRALAGSGPAQSPSHGLRQPPKPAATESACAGPHDPGA